MSRQTTAFATLLTTLALALTGLSLAGPASAAGRDGQCQSGEFCYYYNSDEAGSVSDFTDSIDDYGTTQPTCYEFKGAGNGQGVCVKNNAASVWNRSSKTVRVYFNSNFAGSHQDIAAGTKANLNATLKNNNASHEFLSGSTPTGCKTDGTNSTKPTTILVYRVQLGRVDRVAFKTYAKNVLPERVDLELAGRVAQRRRDGGHELRVVLGPALDPPDLLGSVLRRAGRHRRPGVPPELGTDVDQRCCRPHLGHPDDPQRQHPAGSLLLDHHGLRCLGRRQLDVAVRLTRPRGGRLGVPGDPAALLRRDRHHVLTPPHRTVQP